MTRRRRYDDTRSGVLLVGKNGRGTAGYGYLVLPVDEVLDVIESSLIDAHPDDANGIQKNVADIRALADNGQDVAEQILRLGMKLGEAGATAAVTRSLQARAKQPRPRARKVDPAEAREALDEYVALNDGSKRGYRKALAKHFGCSVDTIDRTLGGKM